MDSVSSPATLVLPARAWPTARTLVYYRDLVLVLLGKEFKVRYKSTVLGYAWSLMHPLAFGLILFVLFRLVGFRMPAYSLFLVAGLFPWQWFNNTVASANFYFLGNASLIKKVRFHRATLVLAGVLNDLVHFCASLPVVVIFMLAHHRYPSGLWLWALPLLISLQLATTLGVGLFVATSNLFFRDLERLTAIGMNLLFYLTPIVIPFEKVPPEYRWALYFNPWAPLTICWQGLFYYGQVPGVFLLVAFAWACGWLALGWLVYSKCVWRFAEVV